MGAEGLMALRWLTGLLVAYGVTLLGSLSCTARATARRLKRVQQLLLVSWVAHTLFVGYRWIDQGHPPFASLYDTLVFFGWALILAFLIVGRLPPHDRVTRGVIGLSLVALGFAFFMDDAAKPLLPALQSHWIAIHVMSCFVGYGAFGVSGVASLFYLLQARKSHSGQALAGLERLSTRAIELGFPFLSVGIIVGSIWANEAWGTYWSWDPKETWALITWIVYAVLLHGQRVQRWRGEALAMLSLVGFLAVLFSFIGVNFLLSGLHSYM